MKKIGLLIEIKDGVLKPANLSMITAARTAGHHLIAILMETTTPRVQDQLATYGVDQLVTAIMEPPGWNPDRWAHAIVDVLKKNDIHTLLGLTTAQGKDLLPRVAAILDAPLVMDCVHVDIDEQMAKTSQYSGKTLATFHLSGRTILYGMRPNAVTPVPHPATPDITEHRVDTSKTTGLEVLQVASGQSGMQNLSEAEVIISGGRGLTNGDNFDLLVDCAREIEGAAVGASRVAVDSGWTPYAMQVGQTGSKVNPKVYIACGISGSIQHLAGMKTSDLIIAINLDADAAIIAHSDYFVIGDLFTIIPALTQELRKNKALL